MDNYKLLLGVSDGDEQDFGDFPDIRLKTEEELNCQVDITRHHVEGLKHVPEKHVKFILETLFSEGMKIKALFKRICNADNKNKAFSVLFNLVKDDSDKRQELLDAVMAAKESVWSDDKTFNPKPVAESFSSAEDFEYLLKNHRDALLYECDESFLISHFSSDEYHIRRVRWYAVKRDYLRAYEELKKAWRGFYVGSKADVPRFGDRDCFSYVHKASIKAISAAVQVLFNLMRINGVISSADLKTEDCFLTDEKITDRVTSRQVKAAGFDFACLFLVQQEPGKPNKPYLFKWEGAMILKIAEFVRQERNSKRRKRQEKKVSDLGEQR